MFNVGRPSATHPAFLFILLNIWGQHSLAADMSACSVNAQVSLSTHERPVDLDQNLIGSLSGRYPQRLRLFLSRGQGRILRVDLEQNRHLLSGRLGPAPLNNTATHDPYNNFCYYHGTVHGQHGSHAAVNLCRNDINGILLFDGSHWVLDGSPLSLYPSSQHNQPDPDCDFQLDHNTLRRRKRSSNQRVIPDYYADYVDSSRRRYVELALVSDYEMYKKYNQNLEFVQDRMIQIANVINSLYYPLNIRIGLVHIEVWTQGDRITITSDPDYTLKNFLYYREKRMLPDVSHDNAQLLSDTVFNDGVVGKAHKGTMCSYERSGGVNVDHSNRVVSVASTVAHEMGHNFGMEHDNDTCECAADRCIMAPSSGGLAPSFWSSCSLEYLAYGLKHGTDHCLLNPPPSLFGGSLCGNGFMDPGEECDCGTPDVCQNQCCDAATCRFTQNAICATGPCCDTDTCTLKAAAEPCRSAEDECDLAEFCDGESESCPTDSYKQDGQPCRDGQGYCGDGRCGIRDDQCRLLWGNTGQNAEGQCYELNSQGTVHGNCGMDRRSKAYAKCLPNDVDCGRLHCDHKNERTVYGDRSVVQTAYTYMTLGRKHFACRVAQLDLGNLDDPDPGMVPGGAKCGTGRMCDKARCTAVEEVLLRKPCDPPDCNGLGVCNERGNCYCDCGYGGKDCGEPGRGGSIDSGPACGPGGFPIGIVLLVLFLLICVAFVAFAFYYRKKRNVWPKPQKLLRYLVPVRPEQRRHYKAPPTTGSPQPPAPTPPSIPNAVLQYPAPPKLPPKVPSNSAMSTSVTTLPKPKSSITTMDISPPVPAAPLPQKPSGGTLLPARRAPAPPETTTVAQAHTMPRLKSRERSEEEDIVPAVIERQPSIRPDKPPPPVPKRPRESVMDSLYAEHGKEILPNASEGSLLHEVLSELAPADPEEPPKQLTPPPEDPVVARRVNRSNSGCSTGKRPAKKPPPPPAASKPTTAIYDRVTETPTPQDDENYYEVIPTLSEDKPKQAPPLPAKPPVGSKVSAIAARFDPKSGTVSNVVMKK